jgi:hypothetical protein
MWEISMQNLGLKYLKTDNWNNSLHKISNCSSFGVKGLIIDMAKISGAQDLHVETYINNL